MHLNPNDSSRARPCMINPISVDGYGMEPEDGGVFKFRRVSTFYPDEKEITYDSAFI
jgi:hypothetical protein